jgi:hypothetical protein
MDSLAIAAEKVFIAFSLQSCGKHLALGPASDIDCTYDTRGYVLISIVFTHPVEVTVNFHLDNACSGRKLPVLVVFGHEHRKDDATHGRAKTLCEQEPDHGAQMCPMFCAYSHSCIKRRSSRRSAFAAEALRFAETHALPAN